MPTPVMRTFEVTKVELLKLSNINIASSSFKAQLWLELTVRGAANDPDFNQDKMIFPMDENNKPTFRPSAPWYMDKLEFNNAEGTPKLLDSLVRSNGDDLVCTLRWEGIFYEHYELHDFPFDIQGLTLSLSINCRTTGMMPAEFAVGSSIRTTVDSSGCVLDDIWSLKTTRLLMRTHLVGSDEDRLFPTLSLSAVVQRNPQYHVYNTVLPFALFSMLAGMQFALNLKPRTDDGSSGDMEGEGGGGTGGETILLGHINHRSQMTLMMVLTAAAYKMAVGGRLPTVAYLTLLDRYMLFNSLYVVLCAVQSRLASLVCDMFGLRIVALYDRYCAYTFGITWLLLQLWFTRRSFERMKQARPREAVLAGNPEFISLFGEAFTAAEAGVGLITSSGRVMSKTVGTVRQAACKAGNAAGAVAANATHLHKRKDETDDHAADDPITSCHVPPGSDPSLAALASPNKQNPLAPIKATRKRVAPAPAAS